eukprot:SAG11_NODE_4412_length_1907_cov_22.596792_2_plen_162_part_01
MMAYIKKQKEQIKSGDPMGCVHPAIQMELDSITSKIKIDETDPKVQELERMLLKAERHPPELEEDATNYSDLQEAPQLEKLTHGKQKDLKTKQEEIEMEQPILVEQDIGVLQLIKKVFDLKVKELEDKLKATQDKVEFAERRIDRLKNKEDWDGECEECGNP